MKTDEEIIDLKQIIFNQKSTIEHLRWENAEKDISFLEEIKQHAIKAHEKRDIASHEMLVKMVNDWIDELKEKTN